MANGDNERTMRSGATVSLCAMSQTDQRPVGTLNVKKVKSLKNYRLPHWQQLLTLNAVRQFAFQPHTPISPSWPFLLGMVQIFYRKGMLCLVPHQYNNRLLLLDADWLTRGLNTRANIWVNGEKWSSQCCWVMHQRTNRLPVSLKEETRTDGKRELATTDHLQCFPILTWLYITSAGLFNKFQLKRLCARKIRRQEKNRNEAQGRGTNV